MVPEKSPEGVGEQGFPDEAVFLPPSLEEVARNFIYKSEKGITDEDSKGAVLTVYHLPLDWQNDLIDITLKRNLPGRWFKTSAMVGRIAIRCGTGHLEKLRIGHTTWMDLRERAIHEKWPSRIKKWLKSQGFNYGYENMLVEEPINKGTSIYCNVKEASIIQSVKSDWDMDQSDVGLLVLALAFKSSTDTMCVPLDHREGCETLVDRFIEDLFAWEINLPTKLKKEWVRLVGEKIKLPHGL